MPYIGNIVQDFSVNTAMLNTDSVTSIKIDDGTIVNADINASAAIDGTKISAIFGTQNITSAGKLRLNPDDNSTTWQRENKHLHQIRDDVYVQSTVNVGDEAGFDFTPLAISAFSYSGTTLTLTTASHTIAVGANILIKDSASGFQEAFNTISGTTGTTIKVTRSSDPSSSLSTANTKVIVYTPADPRGCINVAKDHDKFDQNTFNPILRGYVGKDLDTSAGVNTEFFKIEVKKDSSATDHVATLLHSTKDFGAGQRLALTIDDGNSYPDGKSLVLTQNGVKITTDDSAFTDSDELLEVEGNAKIDGNLEVTGTLSAGGDGTISGDELFLTDSIKHVGDTDTSISFPSNDLIRFRTAGSARLDLDSNGRVGIGTTSLGTHQVVIEGGTAETGGSSLALRTSGGANSITSDLALYGTFVTPTNDQATRRTADIVSGFATANWGTEFLAFHVGKGGTANDTQQVTNERMRIDGSGTIFSISPDDTTPNIKFRSNDTNWFGSLNQSVEGSTISTFLAVAGDWSANGSTYSATKNFNGSFETRAIALHPQFNGGAGKVSFLVKAGGSSTTDGAVSEILKIDNDGIKFGGDTAAANALDDYEEVSFNPIVSQGIDGAATHVIQRGWAVKIGVFVHFSLFLRFSGTGNGNHFRIGGLPFNSASSPYSASYSSGGSVSYTNVHFNNSNPQQVFIPNNTSYMEFYNNNSSNTSISGAGSDKDIYVVGHYRTS